MILPRQVLKQPPKSDSTNYRVEKFKQQIVLEFVASAKRQNKSNNTTVLSNRGKIVTERKNEW